MPKDTLLTTKFLSSLKGKVDKDLFDFLEIVVDDLDEFKQSLLGITRDGTGQLTIHNQPVASAEGDQLVLLMSKLGQISILEREPAFDYADLHVRGHIFGVPPRCIFRKSADTAGLGIYGWDTAEFNNELDMFRTSLNGVAAGQIDVTREGTYRIVAQVKAENAAATVTVVRMAITDLLTGAGQLVISTKGPYAPAGIVNFHTLFHEVTFNSGGGNIVVDLTTGATRLGAGATGVTRIYVTRVN